MKRQDCETYIKAISEKNYFIVSMSFKIG